MDDGFEIESGLLRRVWNFGGKSVIFIAGVLVYYLDSSVLKIKVLYDALEMVFLAVGFIKNL